MSVFTRLSFVSETKPPRSFNLLTQPREFGAPPSRSAYPRTHRRYNSEPFASFAPASKTRLLGDLPLLLERAIPIVEEDEGHRTPQRYKPSLLASPISLDVPAATSHQQQKQQQQQYHIRRPRPDRDSSSSSSGPPPPPCSPEIGLGEPKEHTGHPKTRLTQPVLKLAAIKERLAHLESTNERLQQRAASAATDTALLSASMTYFSSEYYAGLLTIRELRACARRDAAVICELEQEMSRLKRFVGLMVEVGRHEPVLERAYSEVREGREFAPVLVDAVRSAAARRGSGWAQILTAAAAGDSESGPLDDTLKERDASPTQVDDLLKSLKNGNIPPGRHRSAAHKQSPACLSSSPTKKLPALKTGVNLSPTRRPLRALDPNRTKNSSSSEPKAARVGDQTLSSLERILGNFSSGSFGLLSILDDSSSQSGRDCATATALRSALPQIFVCPPTVCAVKKAPFKPLVSPVKSRTRPAAALSPMRGGKKGEWR